MGGASKLLDVISFGLADVGSGDARKKINNGAARPDAPEMTDEQIRKAGEKARKAGSVSTVQTGAGGVETPASKLAKKTLLSA